MNNIGRRIFGVLAVLLLAVMLTGCINPMEEMERELGELDPTSYSDIRSWMENELPYFEEEVEGLEVTITAIDRGRESLGNDFLDNELRFVEWRFNIVEISLTVELVYMTIEEYVVARLTEMDKNSLEGIMEWVEEFKKYEELGINILHRIRDGNYFSGPDDWRMGLDFFIEWDFSTLRLSNYYNVRIELRYDPMRSATAGETFELDGVQFTFGEDITGGRIEQPNSLDDRMPYIIVPVTVENVTEEEINFFTFRLKLFGPDGIELSETVRGRGNDVRLIWDLRPGELWEGYLYLYYDGEGEYVVEISKSMSPFTVDVMIPVYDVEIPEKEDRYSREVEIPEVIFDLGPITLFDHNLGPDSFFYSVPYESELGNTFMILEPGEIVRDPEGVITHDSLRIGYTFFEITSEHGFENAVDRMEQFAHDLQQGDNPSILIGNIHATEDMRTAFLQTRRGVWGDYNTRLFVIQMLPGDEEVLVFETWLWVINEESLEEGDRRSAVEEFGRLTGIDFIQILRDTFEG